VFLKPRLSQNYLVAAKVGDVERSKFFVSVEVNKEVSGVGNQASGGKLSVSYC
jgi:hypothetical protein